MRSPVRGAAAWLAVVSLATSWLASTPGVASARPDGGRVPRLLPDVAPVVEPCVREGTLTWSPSPPRAGTLFRVHLPATVAAQVTTARLAGEPLHFRVDGDSASAFAAVPVDSTRGLTLALLCTNGERVTVRMPTRDGAYPLERLTVAPKFSAPPDSALQARQRRESARAGAVSRAAHSTPRLFTEPFLVPRTTRITSGFGGGRTFNGTVTSRHMGTDYAGAVGAPVRASNRGVVRLVDGFYLGGNVIYLDHGEGLVTAYLHLSRHRVAEGDTVARGQVIGDVGATGRVTGPHLHFIVRYGNVTVDPESVVERSSP
jgi:murein DD-endopeptidase MepM/ murein hydrolase activator NlpD